MGLVGIRPPDNHSGLSRTAGAIHDDPQSLQRADVTIHDIGEQDGQAFIKDPIPPAVESDPSKAKGS